METSNQSSQSCFLRWMNRQEQDLGELLGALNLNAEEDGDADRTSVLSQLVEKSITHFQEYATQRASLAGDNASPYFSPTWCSSLEGSMLWAGGCRPSIFIRLVYALSGKELVTRLDEYLQGNILGLGGLGDMSARQLFSINKLQLETIKQEDKITAMLAGLQEEIADEPIALIAKELHVQQYANSREAEGALDALALSMKSILEEADKLRINTLKELTRILTPIQAVDFLAVSKKLHLCLHAWGKRRDQEHGRS